MSQMIVNVNAQLTMIISRELHIPKSSCLGSLFIYNMLVKCGYFVLYILRASTAAN